MTFEEIADCLGVPTPALVARALGVPVESIRPASPEPVLVLDYRGAEGERRWDQVAKEPIAGLKRKLCLDPRTGLKVERKKEKK